MFDNSRKDKAKTDPESVYKSPRDILTDNSLNRDEKIAILQSWSYDEREKSVAEEENMQNRDNQRNVLDIINECLLALGVDSTGRQAPTKQG